MLYTVPHTGYATPAAYLDVILYAHSHSHVHIIYSCISIDLDTDTDALASRQLAHARAGRAASSLVGLPWVVLQEVLASGRLNFPGAAVLVVS